MILPKERSALSWNLGRFRLNYPRKLTRRNLPNHHTVVNGLPLRCRIWFWARLAAILAFLFWGAAARLAELETYQANLLAGGGR